MRVRARSSGYPPPVASGRTHETVNIVALGALGALYAWGRNEGYGAAIDAVAPPSTRAAFTLAFLVGTFFVTPDMDLAEKNVRAKSNWGLLGLLWVPYGLMFKHRGLSHSWLLGPLTRLAYLVLLGLGALYLLSALGPTFGYSFSVEARVFGNWQPIALGALAGYYLSQWLHLAADGHAPWKGWFRGGRRTGRGR